MTVKSARVGAADLFADTPYDAVTLASMMEAYAGACHELTTSHGAPACWDSETQFKLTARILKAVASGERDPDRIKRLAVLALDRDGSEGRQRTNEEKEV
ncbi:hypothetical protein [Hyphomicrobium sp. D-2]|uniref:hypothetical protein n=1 Tax=Hyphomicrobium sp. D-2 TaxID=3041621 RepID=UPI0024583F72|nr:hypothetical protein [Hyphomicrobium sp. D-2]MDH4981694.1 hypothetical protein [Hyphomicrobium sp. D-2]